MYHSVVLGGAQWALWLCLSRACSSNEVCGLLPCSTMPRSPKEAEVPSSLSRTINTPAPRDVSVWPPLPESKQPWFPFCWATDQYFSLWRDNLTSVRLVYLCNPMEWFLLILIGSFDQRRKRRRKRHCWLNPVRSMGTCLEESSFSRNKFIQNYLSLFCL